EGVDGKGQLVEAHALLSKGAAQENTVKEAHKAGGDAGQGQDKGPLYDGIFLYHGRLRNIFITAYSGKRRYIQAFRGKNERKMLDRQAGQCYPTNRNSE